MGTLHSRSLLLFMASLCLSECFSQIYKLLSDGLKLRDSYGKVAGEDIAVAVSLNIASDWEGLLSEGRLHALKSLRRACCVHPTLTLSVHLRLCFMDLRAGENRTLVE